MIGTIARLLGRYYRQVDDLNEAREKFRAGLINEWKFRGTLRRLGYTQYGIEREVEDQVGRMMSS